MGSVKPEPVFVTDHERAKAWKMRALEKTVRAMRAREKRRADESMSTPCADGFHRRCHPNGNPEHLYCECPCHEEWD